MKIEKKNTSFHCQMEEEQFSLKCNSQTQHQHLDVAVVAAWLARMGGAKEVDVESTL